MGLNPQQFRKEVVRETLLAADMWSRAAENLICGTAYQESGLKWLRQLKNGPALGVYQMEPKTHDDIWKNYLKYRDGIGSLVHEFLADKPGKLEQLKTNLAYATIMCRIHYLRQPDPLPEADDIEGLAHYWKQFYNTESGKGTIPEFIHNYREFDKC